MNLVDYLARPGDDVAIKNKEYLGHFRLRKVVSRMLFSEDELVAFGPIALFEKSSMSGVSYNDIRKV